jgi:hypothetical protein
MHPLFGVLLIAAGLFAIAGAVLNWEWFMNSRKARGLTSLLGRQGTRVAYVVLGLFICTIGVLGACGFLGGG